jgi:hypothetical protein
MDEKQKELIKYRDMVIATIDYFLDNDSLNFSIPGFDTQSYFEKIKVQTEDSFSKGRLGQLKQWFRDITEPIIEQRDLRFNHYLQKRTGYTIDIFKSYFERIDKIIVRGKISTDNQFYDISILVDKLCQSEPIDKEKINILNQLLLDYESKNTSK